MPDEGIEADAIYAFLAKPDVEIRSASRLLVLWVGPMRSAAAIRSRPLFFSREQPLVQRLRVSRKTKTLTGACMMVDHHPKRKDNGPESNDSENIGSPSPRITGTLTFCTTTQTKVAAYHEEKRHGNTGCRFVSG